MGGSCWMQAERAALHLVVQAIMEHDGFKAVLAVSEELLTDLDTLITVLTEQIAAAREEAAAAAERANVEEGVIIQVVSQAEAQGATAELL